MDRKRWRLQSSNLMNFWDPVKFSKVSWTLVKSYEVPWISVQFLEGKWSLWMIFWCLKDCVWSPLHPPPLWVPKDQKLWPTDPFSSQIFHFLNRSHTYTSYDNQGLPLFANYWRKSKECIGEHSLNFRQCWRQSSRLPPIVAEDQWTFANDESQVCEIPIGELPATQRLLHTYKITLFLW